MYLAREGTKQNVIGKPNVVWCVKLMKAVNESAIYTETFELGGKNVWTQKFVSGNRRNKTESLQEKQL